MTMGDERDEEHEHEYVTYPSGPWSWMAFAGSASTFVVNLSKSVACLADDVARMCMQHVGSEMNKQNALDAIHRDMERINDL